MKKNEKIIKEKVIDAKGRTLGRVASEAAFALMGKDSVSYERNTNSNAKVNIKNASKISITPKKLATIDHKSYSGYPGGLRTMTAAFTVKTKGYSELVKLAIYRMLPGNKLRREMMKNLTIEE